MTYQGRVPASGDPSDRIFDIPDYAELLDRMLDETVPNWLDDPPPKPSDLYIAGRFFIEHRGYVWLSDGRMYRKRDLTTPDPWEYLGKVTDLEPCPEALVQAD